MATGTVISNPKINIYRYSGTSGNYGECANACPSGGTIIAVNILKVNELQSNNTCYSLYSSSQLTRNFYIYNLVQGSRIANASVDADIYYV